MTPVSAQAAFDSKGKVQKTKRARSRCNSATTLIDLFINVNCSTDDRVMVPVDFDPVVQHVLHLAVWVVVLVDLKSMLSKLAHSERVGRPSRLRSD
eukprot:5729123-Pleurochrysis_carterae.AAC.1